MHGARPLLSFLWQMLNTANEKVTGHAPTGSQSIRLALFKRSIMLSGTGQQDHNQHRTSRDNQHQHDDLERKASRLPSQRLFVPRQNGMLEISLCIWQQRAIKLIRPCTVEANTAGWPSSSPT